MFLSDFIIIARAVIVANLSNLSNRRLEMAGPLTFVSIYCELNSKGPLPWSVRFFRFFGSCNTFQKKRCTFKNKMIWMSGSELLLEMTLKWQRPQPPRAHVNLWDGSQVVDLAAGWLVMQQWYPCWNPQFFTSSYPVLANRSDIFWHSIWRSLWHSLLAFYLASILTFCLAFFLAFSLARVRVQAHSTASGARDMVSGAQSTVQQEEGSEGSE